MANAIIYGKPGSGKTVNATLVKGKTLLLCTDNSAVVLKNFDRPNLTVKEISSFAQYKEEFSKATESKIYDNIITDCLTDLIDGFIVECRMSKAYNDIRQAYMAIYTEIKYFVRKAAFCGTDCIFTCWEDAETVTLPTGELTTVITPSIPAKIKQQVCGLCNIVAYVLTKVENGNRKWAYYTEGGNLSCMAKDQLFGRKSCKPENIFKED